MSVLLLNTETYCVVSFIEHESFRIFVDITEGLLEKGALDVNLGSSRNAFSTPYCAYQNYIFRETKLPRLWFSSFEVFPTTFGSVS